MKSKCPGNLRGHTWHEPEFVTLSAKLFKTPAECFAMRVCKRCGVPGRVDSQGRVQVVEENAQ